MGTEQSIYDLSLDRMSCPYCPDGVARRIGSSRFSWLCQQNGHQYEWPGPFGAVGIGGYAFVSGPCIVGDDRKG